MKTTTDELIEEITPAFAPAPRPVAEVNLETKEVVKIYKSIKNASDMTGVDRHSISHCCNGRYKQVRGKKFVWVRQSEVVK